MKQTVDFLSQTLFNVINNDIRHQDYNRVVNLASKYKSLVTGEEMDALMRRFDVHESTEAFDQRKKITTHITKSVSKNLIKPLYKVPRSNSAKRNISYANDSNSQKAKELEKAIGNFWENTSLDNWFSQRWIDLNAIDPNSWCVLEWANFDVRAEKAKPYPFEVSSEMAIHFNLDNSGEVQFLVVKNIEYDILGENPVNTYTIYGKDDIVKFTQLTKEQMDELNLVNRNVDDGHKMDVMLGDELNVVIKGRLNDWYKIEIFNHGLDKVPAFRIGFKRDMYTNGRTYLSVIDDAEPILMKIIKANSEMDLTSALHVFPQKIQYANRCDATGCNMGKMPDGKTCKTCGGTGYQIAKTAQDVIYLTMPKDKEDFLNLDNIIKYVSPSVELVKWQDKYIESLTIRCKEAMYNSELFSRKQVAETATGKNIDLQNVYDSLYDMASAFSQKWKMAVDMVAKIRDADDGLTAFYVFSKDFKLKSLTELYQDLKTVADSGADSFVKGNIQDDIARIEYSDDPITLGKYQTEKAFFPFTGKSEKEIMFAISGDLVPERVKVLYLNYGWIFDQLYMESTSNSDGVTFYELSRDKQKELIDEKVDEIMSANRGNVQNPNDMIDG